MTWSDNCRFKPTASEPTFPQAHNYTNLDHFLHDVRLAVNCERKFRRTYNLLTDEARLNFQLDRIALQYDDLFSSPNFSFDVI